MTTEHLDTAVRDAAGRAVAAVGLTGVALIHLLDVTGKFSETPYMGWMYLALMAGCLVLAAELLRSGSRLAWAGAVVLPLSALAGFVLTRTVGLPQAHGDVGNWSEPLGLASMFVEGCLIALGSSVLLSTTTRASRGLGRSRVLQPVGDPAP
jgi:hypothetical protein